MKASELCKGCGIIILNSSIKQPKRAYCKYCFKRLQQEYNKKHNPIHNELDRQRRFNLLITEQCMICGCDYKTNRQVQKTCGSDRCKSGLKRVHNRLRQRELARERKMNERVNK